MNIYQYMHSLPIGGEEAEIDALTVTATGLEGKLSIALIVNELDEELERERVKPWKFQGASGWSKGSVSMANRYNKGGGKLWSVLMVRGELARKAMDVAVNFEDIKYTRVDIRVDISMSGEVQGLPRKIYDTYKGKFPTKLIESNTGDTLYCGSRESGEYIRIYDKSVSYGYCEGSGQVWRFEVEYKNRSAERLAVYLEDNKFENMADVVWASMRKKDLPAPRIGKVVDIRGAYTSLTSAEQKLEWIGRQVRPTVQFLVSLGLVEEVREQLGLFDLES